MTTWHRLHLERFVWVWLASCVYLSAAVDPVSQEEQSLFCTCVHNILVLVSLPDSYFTLSILLTCSAWVALVKLEGLLLIPSMSAFSVCPISAIFCVLLLTHCVHMRVGGGCFNKPHPSQRRKGLVTLQPSSCLHGRNLMWPQIRALQRSHLLSWSQNVFSGCQ